MLTLLVKPQHIKPKGLCGWGQRPQVRPSRAGATAPGPARARPRTHFQLTDPSSTWSVRFQSHATSVRSGQRVSHLTGRLPGLAREVLIILPLFLRAVFPPLRGFEAATSSLAPSGFFGQPLDVHNRYTKQSLPSSYAGLQIPLVPHGLRSALIRHV